MSTVTYNTRPTNGVSYGIKHVVTAADASAGNILFDFRLTFGSTKSYRFSLVATANFLAASTNIVTNPVDLSVTYPLSGQVLLTGTFVEGSTLNLVLQASRTL